jgi:hypothetical protein
MPESCGISRDRSAAFRGVRPPPEIPEFNKVSEHLQFAIFHVTELSRHASITVKSWLKLNLRPSGGQAMRVSSFINHRASFLFAALLFFAGSASPRALNNPRLAGSHRQLFDELIAPQTQRPAVSAGDFSISANPTSLTISASLSSQASFADGTLTLTGLNGFSGNVELTCMVTGGSSQNQPTCFFPALVPADVLFVDATNPASTTSIEADAVTASCNPPEFCALPNIFVGGSGTLVAAMLVLALLSISICVPEVFSRKLRAKVLCFAFICTIGFAAAGCSNGPSAAVANGCAPGLAFTPGTPAGTYMMTVMATSGNLVHSVTVPVIITAQ